MSGDGTGDEDADVNADAGADPDADATEGIEETEDADRSADPNEYDELADAAVETWVDENGLHIAEDAVTGVSSQGPTEGKAVANLAEAVDSYNEAGEDTTGDDWL